MSQKLEPMPMSSTVEGVHPLQEPTYNETLLSNPNDQRKSIHNNGDKSQTHNFKIRSISQDTTYRMI